MKAAILLEPRKIEVCEIPAPAPQEGEVLVKIAAAGVCGTDFAKYRGDLGGKFPLVAGHEGVGTIAAIGSGVKGIAVGQRVAIQPNFACGKCATCLGGRPNICPNRVRLGLDIDGVFAEYVAVPERYVWKLPAGLAWETAALTEPLSVALHGIHKITPKSGDRVLVYGTGAIGLLYVQLATLFGAGVTAFNRSEERLAAALKLGATRAISSQGELEAQGGDFNIIYETSGSAEALAAIIQLAAPGARILLTGLPETSSPIPASLIVRKELAIKGAMTYIDKFGEAIAMLQKNSIRTDILITNVYPLDKLPAVLADFRSPFRIKDILAIS